MNQLFRPSHGSAAEAFVVGWCSKCANDVEQNCPILAALFRDEMPGEIMVNDKWEPHCTAFSDRQREGE